MMRSTRSTAAASSIQGMLRWILLTCCLLFLSTPPSTIVKAQEEDTLFHYYADLGAPTGRIVNGQDAPPDRYPYFVALLDKDGNFRCGGTLIAPNIVLSAAHCQNRLDYVLVGVYNLDTVGTPEDTSQRINIVGRHPNPKWIFEEYSFDQMILVLETPSPNQPIKINLDPNVPNTNTTEAMNATLIGLGKTSAGPGGTAAILQETNITAIDKEECELTPDPDKDTLPFLDRITDDMVCVVGAGSASNSDSSNSSITGQCSGDSGGPYLFKSDNDDDDPANDLQFGLVSWSYGGDCKALYPAVGARTSEIEWIRYITCQYALPPPDYLECDQDEEITFSPAPTRAPSPPTLSPAPTGMPATITLSFYVDDDPHEVFWSIVDGKTGEVMLERPPYYYPRDIELVRETLLLDPGQYILTVEDTHGDGIRNGNAIAYDIILTNDVTDDKFLILERPGSFRNKRTETFQVPYVADYPTDAPSASPTQSAAPTTTFLEVYLTLDFDDWHREIGWSIFDANDPDDVFAIVEPGEYKTGGIVTEEIKLPYPGGVYTLLVEDNFGDGIREPTDGYFLWTKDPSTGDQIVIVTGTGDFEFETAHNFTLPEVSFGAGGNETSDNDPESEFTQEPSIEISLEKKSGNDRKT